MSERTREAMREYREDQQRKSEKVISGTAKVTKRKKSRKILDSFVSEDLPEVRNYIWDDVVAPIIRSCLYDIGVGALSSVFGRGSGGNYGRYGGNGRYGGDTRVSYRQYYDNGPRDRRKDDRYYRRGVYDYDELSFDTYAEADKVLGRMLDQISAYGNVSVLEMYDFSGLSCDYTAKDYGWVNLRRAVVRQGRDGRWYIEGLPKAMPID